MIEHITTPTKRPADHGNVLRPKNFSDFIGQKKMTSNMKVYIAAALKRREPLDHVLLSGPPGLGKTTFAQIIASEMNAEIISTAAPAIEKAGDMAGLLSSIKPMSILFIDEIHRLKPIIEEVLYSAMEDFSIDIQMGQGPTAQTVKIQVPPFTLVGATTKPGSLTQPLISRFGIQGQYEFYEEDELAAIIKKNAQILNIGIDESGVHEISKRSRGTPRILNRILRRVRDFTQIENKKIINRDMADYALNRMDIDSAGLNSMDRKILLKIIDDFGGGPVGIDNLAMSIGEESSTIEEMVEPFLLKKAFVKRTPRGRIATQKAFHYFQKKIPDQQHEQPTFFSSDHI